MKFSDILRTALHALRGNWMRSALTSLGVIIGIAAVIVMVSIGQGTQAEIDKLVSGLGSQRLDISGAGGMGPGGIVIPENILTRPPTAELRENQTDQDSLPPYEALDDILACLVEREMPLEDIVARGHDAATVKKVERLLYIAEYKRRQAAPGVKISARNFGRDRRYPITNRFRETL